MFGQWFSLVKTYWHRPSEARRDGVWAMVVLTSKLTFHPHLPFGLYPAGAHLHPAVTSYLHAADESALSQRHTLLSTKFQLYGRYRTYCSLKLMPMSSMQEFAVLFCMSLSTRDTITVTIRVVVLSTKTMENCNDEPWMYSPVSGCYVGGLGAKIGVRRRR